MNGFTKNQIKKIGEALVHKIILKSQTGEIVLKLKFLICIIKRFIIYFAVTELSIQNYSNLSNLLVKIYKYIFVKHQKENLSKSRDELCHQVCKKWEIVLGYQRIVKFRKFKYWRNIIYEN